MSSQVTCEQPHLEFLRLPNPDLNPRVVAKAGAAEQGNLLLLGEVLGVLAVDGGVVHALCRILVSLSRGTGITLTIGVLAPTFRLQTTGKIKRL